MKERKEREKKTIASNHSFSAANQSISTSNLPNQGKCRALLAPFLPLSLSFSPLHLHRG